MARVVGNSELDNVIRQELAATHVHVHAEIGPPRDSPRFAEIRLDPPRSAKRGGQLEVRRQSDCLGHGLRHCLP